jgi:hypothetical protein
MTMTTEIAGLHAEARNCRKLASMTSDESARAYLEKIADRYDAQREEIEALKASGAVLPKTAQDSLALDRVGAIEIVDDDMEIATA